MIRSPIAAGGAGPGRPAGSGAAPALGRHRFRGLRTGGKFSLTALPLMLLATPLTAETAYSCNFTVECVAAGDCGLADRQVEIGLTGDGIWIYLSETSGPMPAISLSGHGPALPFAAIGTGPASGLLTINPGGTALFSQHRDDGSAVTYFGTCEAAR